MCVLQSGASRCMSPPRLLAGSIRMMDGRVVTKFKVVVYACFDVYFRLRFVVTYMFSFSSASLDCQSFDFLFE